MSRPQPDYVERREATRKPANAPGRVMHGRELGLWADCTIRNLSRKGAKIELSHFHRLPPRFVLLDFRGGLAMEVTLKWRRGDVAGVAFEKVQKLEDLTDPCYAAAREVWVTHYPSRAIKA